MTVDDPDLDAKIAEWRKCARYFGRLAREAAEREELCEASQYASLSSMFFAVALDAHTFGNQAELYDDDEIDGPRER